MTLDRQNKCPHPDCTLMKPWNQYACRTHWFQLPKRIRGMIWNGYKNSGDLWIKADGAARLFWDEQKEKVKEAPDGV